MCVFTCSCTVVSSTDLIKAPTYQYFLQRSFLVLQPKNFLSGIKLGICWQHRGVSQPDNPSPLVGRPGRSRGRGVKGRLLPGLQRLGCPSRSISSRGRLLLELQRAMKIGQPDCSIRLNVIESEFLTLCSPGLLQPWSLQPWQQPPSWCLCSSLASLISAALSLWRLCSSQASLASSLAE